MYFLVALVIYFGLQVNVSTSHVISFWETDLLNEQVMLHVECLIYLKV